jgi:hypothetical protein
MNRKVFRDQNYILIRVFHKKSIRNSMCEAVWRTF